MFWQVICVIDYKQELQGLVIINEEINSISLYYPALIKHMECFYLIDPHARNCLGMPDH